MKEYPRKLEMVANVTIILFAVLFGAILINKYFVSVPDSRNSNAPQLETGTKLNLGKVDWSSHKTNVVLAFSTTCSYCLASVDFYKQILQIRNANEDIRLIVVSSQPQNEVEEFLDRRELEVDQVIQVTLSDLSINGTPTLISVDSNGLVQNFWVGRLPPDREQEVLAALH